jgi:DNA gyrase subunit B
MILEVLAYANDEAECLGRVGIALVTMWADGAVTVADDGRGTDTRVDADGRVIRKAVMATKDVRFFDAVDGPRLADGLPRRGMSTVAALSPDLTHENHRANGAWSQTYRHGIPAGELRAIRAGRPSGTSVTFRPDARVSGPAALTDADLIAFPWLRIEVRTTP